jgi:hypothetical protein
MNAIAPDTQIIQPYSGSSAKAEKNGHAPRNERAPSKVLRLRTLNSCRLPHRPEAYTEKDRDKEDDEPGRPHSTNA